MRTLLLLLLACEPDKDEACLSCPALEAAPCNKGADPAVEFYYCDPCGEVWVCAQTGEETNDFLYWRSSEVSCGCVEEDGRLSSTGDCAP